MHSLNILVLVESFFRSVFHVSPALYNSFRGYVFSRMKQNPYSLTTRINFFPLISTKKVWKLLIWSFTKKTVNMVLVIHIIKDKGELLHVIYFPFRLESIKRPKWYGCHFEFYLFKKLTNFHYLITFRIQIWLNIVILNSSYLYIRYNIYNYTPVRVPCLVHLKFEL